MSTVTVLFARQDSVYKSIDNCDVWDIERDARKFTGANPIVAHPPCRAWGRLRTFANPRKGERLLATFAVRNVRTHGGVLEHPSGSTLWAKAGLPRPGCGCDAYGGWTLPIDQNWWGHKAKKSTWLYIVGCTPSEVPIMPLQLGDATHVVQSAKHDSRPHITKSEREHTPIALAKWLVNLAQRCKGAAA